VTTTGTTPGRSGVDRDQVLRSAVHRRLLASEGAEVLVGAAPADLRARIAAFLVLEDPLLGGERRDRLVAAVFDDVVGLGALEPLLLDSTIDEIMVNGSGRCFVERAGAIEAVPLQLDDAGILRLAQRILAPLALRLDRSSPMVDARLPDGSRLHAVIPPLAIDGPCLTIRRFGARAMGLDAFGVSGEADALLRQLVADGANVVISGGTGSGKTTLLNALAGHLGAAERIITIEETAELRLPQPHVVRLEARPANAEGAGAYTVRDLVRAALRMRPDRLVVGEVRGAEALDLLQALNTGHDGSISTVHANSPLDALRRLSTLALFGGTGLPHDAICEQLRASVDVVIQVARGGGGTREVVAVVEVVDVAGPFAVRPLLVRTPVGLVVEGSPERGGRRSRAR
jgi:pilus assembly protein CpaF